VTGKGVSTSHPFRFDTGISRFPQEVPDERNEKNCRCRIWNCVKTGFNFCNGCVQVFDKNTFTDVFMHIEALQLLPYAVQPLLGNLVRS
jgi:hypothetical protein